MFGVKKTGFSMVELMVAIAIIGLAIGPLILVLSDSNKANKASIYEEMATHYARELAHQFLRMDKDIAHIVQEAKIQTGNSALTFKEVLSPINGASSGKLSDLSKTQPYCIPIKIGGKTLDYRLIVSSLIQPAFKNRKIEIVKLSTSSNNVLKNGNFWKVIITISWADPNSGRTIPRELKLDVMLHET